MKREVALCVIAGNFRGDLSDFKPGGRVTVHKSKHYKSGMGIFLHINIALCARLVKLNIQSGYFEGKA